jgi:hypothetical protein
MLASPTVRLLYAIWPPAFTIEASNDPANGMKMWCLFKCLFIASPGGMRPCPTLTPGQDKTFAKLCGAHGSAKLVSIDPFDADITPSCYLISIFVGESNYDEGLK